MPIPSRGEGGGPNPPYGEDFFQRIVGVHWPKKGEGAAGNVIVVFVDQMTISAQLPSSYQILSKTGVTFLTSWKTPYQAGGFQPGFNSVAYQVNTSSGEFMKSITPNTLSSDGNDFGCWQTCAVFAIGEDLKTSVDRAEAGVKKIVPATYLFTHSEGDIPAEMCPPGLLWLVETVTAPRDTSFVWKIRFGKHRRDSNTSPPNDMVQVYPLNSGYAGAFPGAPASVSGYPIYGYRLDKEGIGQVYGKQHFYTDGEQPPDDPLMHTIAIEWDQQVISSSSPAIHKGILFQDPPPLIGADV